MGEILLQKDNKKFTIFVAIFEKRFSEATKSGNPYTLTNSHQFKD